MLFIDSCIKLYKNCFVIFIADYLGATKMKKSILLFLFFCIAVNFSYSQHRIAVLPFKNMDGKLNYNIWCYKLQDSLEKKLIAEDPDNYNYIVVPADSIEIILADLNLDPTNPQYESDMWKAVKQLNIDRVVSGNFYIQRNRLIINAFVYDVDLKIPHPDYQAKNIFKSEDKVLSAVPIISQKLRMAIIGN